MATPKVSVIVPNYNYARYLPDRIDSILKQTFQDFELILLDDASTDGSAALLERWRNHPKVSHIVVNDTNSGSPLRSVGARNRPGAWRIHLDSRSRRPRRSRLPRRHRRRPRFPPRRLCSHCDVGAD